jgi:DNA integrity scanning protein DisA with diadenylate cyclase activity
MGDALHLPLQMETLTEILQECLLEMTAKIDRRKRQLIDKIQTSEDRLHKSERKTSVERQHHRQYIDKTMRHLEDWEENLLQREQMLEQNQTMMRTQYKRYTGKYVE